MTAHEEMRNARAGAREALAGRVLHGLAMLAALVVMLGRLPAAERGIFFSFLSLLTLAQVFDFGLCQAVIRKIGSLHAGGGEGDFSAVERVALRRSFALQSFGAGVTAFVGYALAAGAGARGATDAFVIAIPWTLAATCNAGAQWLGIRLAAIEGLGDVRRSYRIQLEAEAASGAAFLVGLLALPGYWSLTAYAGARFAAVAFRTATPVTRRARNVTRARVARDLWHLQWRVGLNALASFAGVRALNPVLLATLGAIEAARLGTGVAAMAMLFTVTSVVPVSQTAYFARSFARGHLESIARAIRRTMRTTSILALLAAAVGAAAISALPHLGIATSDRFPAAPVVAVLLLGTIPLTALAAFSIALRADGRDPMLGLNLVTGFAAPVACALAAALGELGVAVAYVLVPVVGLPVAFAIYRTRMRAWTSALPAHRPGDETRAFVRAPS